MRKLFDSSNFSVKEKVKPYESDNFDSKVCINMHYNTKYTNTKAQVSLVRCGFIINIFILLCNKQEDEKKQIIRLYKFIFPFCSLYITDFNNYYYCHF